jgi:hypothetical protein
MFVDVCCSDISHTAAHATRMFVIKSSAGNVSHRVNSVERFVAADDPYLPTTFSLVMSPFCTGVCGGVSNILLFSNTGDVLLRVANAATGLHDGKSPNASSNVTVTSNDSAVDFVESYSFHLGSAANVHAQSAATGVSPRCHAVRKTIDIVHVPVRFYTRSSVHTLRVFAHSHSTCFASVSSLVSDKSHFFCCRFEYKR